MQLIKLVYLCHGWTMGLYSRPLIENVEAWQYALSCHRFIAATDKPRYFDAPKK